jgi:NADPH:quinone reductase
MRAVEVRATGGPEVLDIVTVEDPQPGPGQVVVDVAAAGVNFIDTYQRAGVYRRALPFRPGYEGAGTVSAVGPGVDDVAVGDVVAWKDGSGSYAERVTVAAAEVLPVPGVDVRTAAALPLQGLTAHYLATASYPVGPGDWVGVHAAAGGVGRLLTQIVRLRGGHVVATTSSAAKAELARSAGADVVVGYDEFVAAAREATAGEGLAAVYDGVGRATFDASLDALRPRGVQVLYGGSSGQVPPLDLQVLAAKGSLYVTRPSLGAFTRTREELLARSGELLDWVRAGRLDVLIGATYPLDDASRAHADLEGRRTTGKLLLLP